MLLTAQSAWLHLKINILLHLKINIPAALAITLQALSCNECRAGRLQRYQQKAACAITRPFPQVSGSDMSVCIYMCVLKRCAEARQLALIAHSVCFNNNT